MKLHTFAPHESRICTIDYRVNGILNLNFEFSISQGHGLLVIENIFRTVSDRVFHL